MQSGTMKHLHERGSHDKRRSRSPLAKSRIALSLDPANMTEEELREKLKSLGQLSTDKDGFGIFQCTSKRILPTDVPVLVEVFKRFTEIQTVLLSSSLITDDVLLGIIKDGIKELQHVKVLDLSFNVLSRPTVTSIIELYTGNSRSLESLDLRNNNLNFRDGQNLFLAFQSSVRTLNGIHIGPLADSLRLDLSKHRISEAEIAILSEILYRLESIRELSLGSNNINSHALVYLSDAIARANHIETVDLSNNPLVHPGNNIDGLTAIMRMLKKTSHVCDITFAGAEKLELAKTRTTLGKYRDEADIRLISRHAELMSQIESSLAVNRSIRARSQSDNPFLSFAISRLGETAAPERVNVFLDWKPSFFVDQNFCLKNKIQSVKVRVGNGEEIILT